MQINLTHLLQQRFLGTYNQECSYFVTGSIFKDTPMKFPENLFRHIVTTLWHQLPPLFKLFRTTKPSLREQKSARDTFPRGIDDVSGGLEVARERP